MIERNKAKDFRRNMKKILFYMREYKINLIFAFTFAILGTSFSILGPNILRKATNKLSEGIIAKARGVENAKIDINTLSIKHDILIFTSFHIIRYKSKSFI